MTIQIGQHIIKKDGKPFIIAEAGINHNGDLDLAKQMVKVALEAGCSAVKFQTFKASEFCGDPNQTFTYKSQDKEVTESMLEMFERHEFTPQQWLELKNFCKDTGIAFLSTPQNESDLELLLDIGVDAIKIGSDDFTNLPLIKRYGQTGLPVILSCGMSDLSEVYQALNTLEVLHNPDPQIVLCLCTSQYPTPPQDINLRKFETLNHAFPNITKGFSDHSQGYLASSLAVAFGAVLFEKHFTMSNELSGPDHWFSENPETLKQWVKAIQTSHNMLGSAVVSPTKAEEEMRVLARRSIVAIEEIKVGEKLNNKNIGLRRPGNGLPPAVFEQVIGMKANRNIKASELIKFGDFTDD